MITSYHPNEIAVIRTAGSVTAAILDALAKAVKPGMTTADLDTLAQTHLRKYPDARAAFLGYRGYPAILCTSVNDVVVHGIPSRAVVLRSGDIVGIDFGVAVDGFYADAAVTVSVGSPRLEGERIISAAKSALEAALRVVRPGKRIGDIGAAVQQIVEKKGYGVVRDLVGHGVGRSLHEDPKIPNVGTPGTGERLIAGAVLAIEPMITAGSWEVTVDADTWTVRTADHSLAAHVEHTILVTKNGYEILTKKP